MNRFLIPVGLVLVVIAAGIWGWTGHTSKPPQSVSPAIGGPFTLVDHTGRTVTEADFRGRYLLIFFGYTYCPDVCPTTLQTITDAMNILGDDARQVQPIFISVDSDRDGPDVMKLYVDAFGGKIAGLSGTPDQIKAVTKAYGVYYAKVANPGGGADGYLMSHSTIVYLMGPDGAFVTHFSHGTTAEEMATKIRSVLD